LKLTGERYIFHCTSVGERKPKPIEDKARAVKNNLHSNTLRTDREGVKIDLLELEKPAENIKEFP